MNLSVLPCWFARGLPDFSKLCRTRIAASFWATTLLFPAYSVQAQEACGAACVFAGPRLASVQTSEAELLGPILSGLLGTDLSLSVLDWNALAGAEIDLLGLLGENGQDVTVSDPEQVANVDLTILELVQASAAVAEADGDTALVNALNVLSVPVADLNQTINLANLITIGLPQGSLANLELNALDLIGGAIQLYNYENVVTTPEPVALQSDVLQQFGIGGAEILLQVVEPPHFECGSVGTQFHTSAVRAKLTLDLADMALDSTLLDSALGGLGGLTATDIAIGDLDLYFEFGRVEGTILSADPATKTASVMLAPSAVDVFLGEIDDAIFFNRTRPIAPSDVGYATVGQVDISLLGGAVRESAGIRVKSLSKSGSQPSETLVFSPPYPQRQAISSGASSFADLIGALADNLDVQVEDSLGNLVGPLVDTTVEPLVGDLIGGLLVDAVSPILDLTVNPLLGFFGIGIGEADASVTGVTSICTDYADCPTSGLAPDGSATASYGAPYHFIYETLFLGSAVPDAETGHQGNATASGDDEKGNDDEDGVVVPPLPSGTIQTVEITVRETGGDVGYLQAWIDWDGDGTFEANEQIASDVTSGGVGVISLSVAVPPTARPGNSFARFRWSTQSGLNPIEIAPDGEVEDYAVVLSGPSHPRLSGNVIADTGAGNGIPHDGSLNGGELGLGEISVRVETPDAELIALALTDDLGGWSVSLPAGFDGPVVVSVVPPNGMVTISESTAGSPAIIPSSPNDGQILLDLSADSIVSNLTLGVVPLPRLAEDSVVYAQSGQIALLPHDYVAGSAGSVSFSVENLTLPAEGGASVALFHDENCDGATGAIMSAPFVVEADERICILSRVATGSGLPDGAAITYQLIATTTLAGDSVVVQTDNMDRVIIGRNGGIVLEKTVENLTRMTGEGHSNKGGPGDLLLYRIRIVNTGAAPVRGVKVHDHTPPYTSLEGEITQAVTINSGAECALALPDTVTAGYVGGIRWECDGEVLPGSTAAFEFRIRIQE